MRCVGWVGAVGLVAISFAAASGACAEDFDPAVDASEFERRSSAANVATPFGLPASDTAWFDPTDDEGLFGDLPAATTLPPLTDFSSDRLTGGRAPPGLLFGGYDLWRNGVSLYGGFEWSADAAAESGPVFRLFVSEALERYQSARFIYVSDISRASLLAGWRFKFGAFELKMLAGPDLEHRASTPDIRDKRWRGSHGGVRVALEGWAEPTPETMLACSFYATTVARSYGARLAAGWRMLDRFWLGPEMSGSSDEFSRQTRVGLHLSGLQLAALEWSAAAGYVRDSFGRDGIYTRLGAALRQ